MLGYGYMNVWICDCEGVGKCHYRHELVSV